MQPNLDNNARYMISIAFRYIFKKLLGSFFVIAPIIILLVWMTISIRFINFIVSDDISISTFFRLISCNLSTISSSIIPVCALIASITVFYRMQSNKEIMVLMTSGKGKLSICKPLFAFATIISVMTLVLLTAISPYSQKNALNIQQKIQSQIPMAVIKPGVFNVIGDSVVYIREKTNDSLVDVFISYAPKNQSSHTNIITAKRGRYLVNGNKLLISLEQGYRQELDQNNNAISTLKFDNFSYDVTEFVQRYARTSQKPYEKTQAELLEGASRAADPKTKQKYIAEYHSRFLLPFINLINSIIVSIFMLQAYIRNHRIIQVIKCFVAGMTCQIAIMTMANSAIKYAMLIQINYAIVLVAMIFLLFISFRRKAAS